MSQLTSLIGIGVVSVIAAEAVAKVLDSAYPIQNAVQDVVVSMVNTTIYGLVYVIACIPYVITNTVLSLLGMLFNTQPDLLELPPFTPPA